MPKDISDIFLGAIAGFFASKLVEGALPTSTTSILKPNNANYKRAVLDQALREDNKVQKILDVWKRMRYEVITREGSIVRRTNLYDSIYEDFVNIYDAGRAKGMSWVFIARRDEDSGTDPNVMWDGGTDIALDSFYSDPAVDINDPNADNIAIDITKHGGYLMNIYIDNVIIYEHFHGAGWIVFSPRLNKLFHPRVVQL